MNKQFQQGLFQAFTFLVCLTAFTLPALAQTNPATINRVAMVGNERGMELQITASRPVASETQLVAGPDRFVIDFPGAVPGAQLRGLTLNQGGIRSVRVGLFRSNPPVTRVVLDLNSPGQYQVLPSGNNVIVRLGGAPGIEATIEISRHVRTQVRPQTALRPQPAAPTQSPGLHVDLQDGLLSIVANKATLAEVLYQVQRLTGADIPIPAGAERERVVVNAGPGPAKDVIATVLTGTPFNFVVVGSEADARGLQSVILTPKDVNAAEPPPQPPQSAAEAQADVVPVPEVPTPDLPNDNAQPQPPPMQPGTNPQQIAPPTEPPPPPMQPDENAPPQQPDQSPD